MGWAPYPSNKIEREGLKRGGSSPCPETVGLTVWLIRRIIAVLDVVADWEINRRYPWL
jgi:hypothetical protein